MNVVDAWQATKQWGPFALGTAGYGAVSCALGPMTSDRRASLWAMQSWCKSSVKRLRIDVEVDGLHHVPTNTPFVYCSNHQSIVDIIVLGSVLVGDYKWAAKRSLMKIPFLGWHLRLAGHVPVDRRSGARAAADVIHRFEDVLRGGKPLLVFPEGTRSEDGYMKSFKNGGFYAAARAGVPVIPVALEGTFDMLRRGARNIGSDERHRLVRVRIGAPIYPKVEGRESARVADLRDRTFEAVGAQFVSLGGRIREKKSISAEMQSASL